MTKLPRDLQAYIALVVSAAMAWTLYILATHPLHLQQLDLYYSVLLASMIAVAGRFPLHLSPKRKVIVETAPLLAAILLLSPPGAVLTCVLGKSAAQILTTGPGFQKAFNLSVTALSTGLAALVHFALQDNAAISPAYPAVVPWLATACVLCASDIVIIEGIVSLQLKQAPFHRWWSLHRQELQHELTLILLGMFAAVIAERHPLALLLLAAPTAMVYRSLKDGLLLQVQTRETVEMLADIVDMRDHYTFEHSKRVASLARDLALAMRLDIEEAEAIYTAARVHDVGKIGIKGQVLLKEGKLSEDEWSEMKSHPEVGAKLVSKLPEFSKGRALILHHHEHYDGKGYPKGLKATEIPLGARIITVADAYDAMTSNRSYRAGLGADLALEQLRRGSGTQFDPAVVEAFLTMIAPDALPASMLKDQLLAPPSMEALAAG